jgi:orotate phosphoribosyltransferase
MNPQDIASLLLRLEAVRISVDAPFTWTSGIEAPIYCDLRILLSHPEERSMVASALVEVVQGLPERPQAIAGTATAGIGWAMLIADRLHLPFVYVRPKPKEHGAKQRIEGELPGGSHVLVVEDLLSTGGSALGTVEALREEGGCSVSDVVAIFTYGFREAEQSAEQRRVSLHVLSDLPALLHLLRGKGGLPEQALMAIEAFAQDPVGWGKRRGR